jgi:hypothetical protein
VLALKTPLRNADERVRSPSTLPVHGGKQRQDRAALHQYFLAKRINVVILNAATTAGIDNQCVGDSDAGTL